MKTVVVNNYESGVEREQTATHEYEHTPEEEHHFNEQEELRQIESSIAALFNNQEDKKFMHPGKKFSTTGQVSRYFKDLETQTQEEAKSMFKQRLKEDLNAHVLEFQRGMGALPNPVALEGDEIICPKYGNCKLKDLTSEKERDGAYFRAVTELENKIKTANPNSFFTFTSPPGWHGMTTADGLLIPEHEESQTWVYFLDRERKLSSMTIRTGMDVEQSNEFLGEFGGKNAFFNYYSEQENLVRISGTVVSGKANCLDQAGVKVLEEIRKTMKTDVLWMRDKKDPFTYKDLKRQIKDLDTQSFIPKNIEAIIDKACEQAVQLEIENAEDIKKLVRLIGQSVLDITSEYEGLTGTQEEKNIKANKILEEKVGCSGGSASAERKTMVINGEVHYLVKKCPHCYREIEKYIKAGYRCNCGQVFKGC